MELGFAGVGISLVWVLAVESDRALGFAVEPYGAWGLLGCVESSCGY